MSTPVTLSEKFGRAVHVVHTLWPDITLTPTQTTIIEAYSMWLKTDYEFGIPMAEFTLSVRELRACTFRDDVARCEDKPGEVEKVVKELIRFYRPSLADASVVALSFREMMWVITLAHSSLPKFKRGEWQQERFDLTKGDTQISDGIEIDANMPEAPIVYANSRGEVFPDPTITKSEWMQTPPEVLEAWRKAMRTWPDVASGKAPKVTFLVTSEQPEIIQMSPTGRPTSVHYVCSEKCRKQFIANNVVGKDDMTCFNYDPVATINECEVCKKPNVPDTGVTLMDEEMTDPGQATI